MIVFYCSDSAAKKVLPACSHFISKKTLLITTIIRDYLRSRRWRMRLTRTSSNVVITIIYDNIGSKAFVPPQGFLDRKKQGSKRKSDRTVMILSSCKYLTLLAISQYFSKI